METKKTPKASLENKRVFFLEIGTIAALLAVIGIFSYSSSAGKVSVLQASLDDVPEVEITPITMELPPEPPKLPDIPVFSEVIEIVSDDVKTDFQVSIDDTPFEIPIREYIGKTDETNVEEEELPFISVETKPTFMGSDANAFSRWIAQHLVYPEIAKETGLSGRVTLQFTIRKDGTLGNIKVLRGVDPVLDQEAIRVVSTSPRWEPGRQQDRAVNVTYLCPVIFKLR